MAQGNAYSASVSLTRTADTNAYTANDVVGAATDSTAALTFNIGRQGGGAVVITTVSLQVDASSVPSGMTSFRLYLYNTTPASALGDNAAFDLPSGDRSAFVGYVDLGTPVDLGSTLYVETVRADKHVVVPASGALYGYLVTNGAFTPASATVFRITLNSIGL